MVNRGDAFLLIGLAGVLALAGCGPNLPPTMRGRDDAGGSASTNEASESSGGEAEAPFSDEIAQQSMMVSEQSAPALSSDAAPVAASAAGPSVQMEVATLRSTRSDAPQGAARFRADSNTRGAKSKLEGEGTPIHQAPRDPAHDSAGHDEHELSLIYDAVVELSVYETEKTIDTAEQLARDAGGYVVQRNDHAVMFRVPTAKFQATYQASLKLGDVLHRRVTVRDVTEEFRDLRIRLRNAEAVRERLEQLLARADKVAEALEVEHELERVAGEIELIKGKLAMLSELTAFSTITLQFESRPIDRVNSQVRLPFPWLDELGLSELLSL